MNLTTEQLEQILGGAPEGASDVLLDHEWNQTYIKKKKDSWFWYKPDQSYWFQFDNMPTMQTIRNLYDLREILTLRQRVQELESQVPKRWFTYCCDDGYVEHESEDAAKSYGDELVRSWLHDCWGEEVDNVRMGIVTHQATEGDRTYQKGELDEGGCDEDGIWWQPEWDYMVSWSLDPIPQPTKEKDDE